ncbi:hypothetical protein ILUMI_00222 [Ignelater luminosus]|uniref:Uncharacterized protein n=1 Tax=Ignelater luminosus TaxID=2038154 RepID=A0A8K0DHP3_IGNLU|nr:hypothetical protein ILUMI_00222 [Ignelater luminosus]
MEAYVNQMIDTVQKLKCTGFEIDDNWIGSLLLADLPEKYLPMLIAIEQSGIDMKADKIKTKLMNMEPIDNAGSNTGSGRNITTKTDIKETMVANNTKVAVSCFGDINITTKANSKSHDIAITNAVCVLDLTINLLSNEHISNPPIDNDGDAHEEDQMLEVGLRRLDREPQAKRWDDFVTYMCGADVGLNQNPNTANEAL